MLQLSPRQVHLDFHTSEHIPDIAGRFDPAAFAQTVRDAHISSMTVFARCHHGWMYYPSRKFPQQIHPNLENQNLMLDQVKALHAQGVRAPVYITVQWDYQMAKSHPEWLIRKADGAHEGSPFFQPGFYQSLCVNTGYFSYLEEHTREVCEILGSDLDGVFFDIVGIRPCWCATCREEMKVLGIDPENEDLVREFATHSLDRFKDRMTAVVREYSTDCTIFYNAGHVGPCTRHSKDAYTHFELESLPGDSWGYLHFPVTARYARTLGKDCMGMTGKFHTGWGDFHSLKNRAALEFECFRMLSFGFASSIGDQLEPDGLLNPATYRLIGSVYGPFAEREEWARPSVPLVEAAVLTSENPLTEQQIPDTVLGACQMLEELGVQFDVVDEEDDLSRYPLLFLPGDLMAGETLREKLDRYIDGGGKIIACLKGGLSSRGKYPMSFGVELRGLAPGYPDFVIAEGPLAGGLEPGAEYVMYKRGMDIRPTTAKVLLQARGPYFNREGRKFCSHRYTPSAKGESYPVATRNGNVILFSHPLFEQYRENAPHWCKQLVANAIDLLLPDRLVRHNGPSTMTVSLLDQPEKNRTCVHLLSYIPVRKSATIDIVEERTLLRDVILDLRLPHPVKEARLVPDNIPLEVDGNKVVVPEVDGYAIVELSY